MAPFIARGTQKPPLGAQINPEHPLGQAAIFAMLLHPESRFGTSAGTGPVVLTGTASANAQQPTSTAISSAGGATWTSNTEGSALWFSDSTIFLNVYDQWSAGACGWVPLSNATVCVIRRKVDTTLRNGQTFGVSVDPARCTAYMPYSDGVVYWDFGGTSGANRLTVSGLSFPTTPERWIFHAGAAGSAIWRNGIKLASQATAVTRSATSSFFNINGAGGAGDNQEINYVAAYATQWTDDRCRWWSAEPYAHLYPISAQRRYFLLGNLATTASVFPTSYYAQQRQQAT